MKTRYITILLLLIATTTIQAQDFNFGAIERTPFEPRNDYWNNYYRANNYWSSDYWAPHYWSSDPFYLQGGMRPLFTATTAMEAVMNYRFIWQSEMFMDFSLASNDFLVMKDLGQGLAKDPSSNDDWLTLPYSDPTTALKIPVGDGIEIMILLLMIYLLCAVRDGIYRWRHVVLPSCCP